VHSLEVGEHPRAHEHPHQEAPHKVGKIYGKRASKEDGILHVMFLLSSQIKEKLYMFFTLGKGCLLIGLAYQGKKDIVFIFIIEYNSLRDFDP
jgi:hypothetical protein